jgi:hypothetical protein
MHVRRWCKPIDKHGATEIVNKTRAAETQKVDIAGLEDDLNIALNHCEWQWKLDIAAARGSRKSLEAFVGRVRKIENDLIKSKHAAALQALLTLGAMNVGASDDFYQALGLGPDESGNPFFDQRIDVAIPRLLTAIALLRSWAKGALNRSGVGRSRYSALETLVAQFLPHLFKRHFGKPFGAGTAGNRVADGPGIRFVLATLTAASITRQNGKPYSAETVRTYWQNAQKQRSRRAPER